MVAIKITSFSNKKFKGKLNFISICFLIWIDKNMSIYPLWLLSLKGIGASNIFLYYKQHWILYENFKYKLQASFYRIKNLYKLLRYCNFCEKFLIQMYRLNFFWVQFSWKFEKYLKIYLLPIFLSNLLYIFRICPLYY